MVQPETSAAEDEIGRLTNVIDDLRERLRDLERRFTNSVGRQ